MNETNLRNLTDDELRAQLYIRPTLETIREGARRFLAQGREHDAEAYTDDEVEILRRKIQAPL